MPGHDLLDFLPLPVVQRRLRPLPRSPLGPFLRNGFLPGPRCRLAFLGRRLGELLALRRGRGLAGVIVSLALPLVAVEAFAAPADAPGLLVAAIAGSRILLAGTLAAL